MLLYLSNVYFSKAASCFVVPFFILMANILFFFRSFFEFFIPLLPSFAFCALLRLVMPSTDVSFQPPDVLFKAITRKGKATLENLFCLCLHLWPKYRLILAITFCRNQASISLKLVLTNFIGIPFCVWFGRLQGNDKFCLR